MNAPERQILTPGDTAAAAAPVRRKPGPKPRAEREAAAAEGESDDLAEFDSDELPPAPAMARSAATEFSPEQQAVISTMIAEAVRASRSSQDPGTAARMAAAAPTRLPSQADALVMLEDAVNKGIRPRAILTPDGWVTHREMTRVKEDIARLSVGSSGAAAAD